MRIIDADVFLGYLIFSKHIDSLKCKEVREAIEMSKVDVLYKIRAEIENHCGLTKENHCRYCSYCNSVMGVREILEIIDKYKSESEDKDE